MLINYKNVKALQYYCVQNDKYVTVYLFSTLNIHCALK